MSEGDYALQPISPDEPVVSSTPRPSRAFGDLPPPSRYSMPPTNFGSSAPRPPSYSPPSPSYYSTPSSSYSPPSPGLAPTSSPSLAYRPSSNPYSPSSLPPGSYGTGYQAPSVNDIMKTGGERGWFGFGDYPQFEMESAPAKEDDGWMGVVKDVLKDSDLYIGFAGMFASIMAARKNLDAMEKQARNDRQHREQLQLQQQAHAMAMLDKRIDAEEDSRGGAIDTSGATDVMRQTDSFA